MITLKTILYKNLLSSGNTPTTIQLDKSKKTLISGTNGSGKSLIIDAITFALFGKPFRKINKAQLINSINGKDCVVEIEFDIGTRSYLIRRGIKPNIFEIFCNGTLVDQTAAAKDYQNYLETQILKLNFKSFTQIVVLGSASFIPFMQLTTGDRRAIVEDILNIQIFSKMKEVLKARDSVLKDEINQKEYDLSLLDNKIEINKGHLAELNKKGDKRKEEIQRKIDAKEKDRLHFCEQVKELNEKVEKDTGNYLDRDENQAKLNQLNTLSGKIQNREVDAKTYFRFLSANSNCSLCKQEISEEFKNQEIAATKSKIDELANGLVELNKKKNEICKVLDGIEEGRRKLQTIASQLSKYTNELSVANSLITRYKEELEETVKEDTSKDILSELDTLQKQQESHLESKVTMTESKYYNQIISGLLTDSGIKAKVIEQYLPIINKRVNLYLTHMNSHFNFELDDTFSEKIQSRYRDDFSYNSFSEGQKKRIDIALLLTWRHVATMKNSVDINLLFMDEVFDSSLDNDGIEDVMLLFNNMKHCNLFVISHRGELLEDKFESRIRIEMKNKFTVTQQE